MRLLDLQIFNHRDFDREVREFTPDAVGFSLNYLAKVPEAVDLAKLVKEILRAMFVFVGGHSVSFIADEVLRHGDGAIDAVVMGEGEVTAPAMLERIPNVTGMPGVATLDGHGPRSSMKADINTSRPERSLSRKRHKYFIGELDLRLDRVLRGCPWDCSFCSAWTFYGRSYRQADPALWPRRCDRSANPTSSSSTTSRSSTPTTAWPSPTSWSGEGRGSATTSKPAATC